jgi:hypothetical protein
MATTKKTPKKKLFRFYGFYNNISIGPNIHLNNVKIVLHEQMALTIDEAYELYKIHLVNKVGVLEKDVEQYLIDLYYKSINVEEIDLETSQSHVIELIK